jgi:hypothetical protein
MQTLIQQLIKFGFVGEICFVIDGLIGLIVLNILMALLSGECFETASVIASAVGLVINSLIIWIAAGSVYGSNSFLQKNVGYNMVIPELRLQLQLSL